LAQGPQEPNGVEVRGCPFCYLLRRKRDIGVAWCDVMFIVWWSVRCGVAAPHRPAVIGSFGQLKSVAQTKKSEADQEQTNQKS
jgi:hypothetical protein